MKSILMASLYFLLITILSNNQLAWIVAAFFITDVLGKIAAIKYLINYNTISFKKAVSAYIETAFLKLAN
ncbi:hypothetical protein [Adhaeribacter pallidiroseus]|uniref:hypothetical protein n=1 Tax=Adhaeribacter pallidiroseus TaxID=2072847 RepID=UPI000E1B6EF7|nr:hypothetical protein [Adhaeribacter pallidiroseus]